VKEEAKERLTIVQFAHVSPGTCGLSWREVLCEVKGDECRWIDLTPELPRLFGANCCQLALQPQSVPFQ